MASSDAYYDAATYDTHGNTKTLGTGTTKTTFNYDSSDRNSSIVESKPSGVPSVNINYQRDVQDRITYHNQFIGSSSVNEYYGFTSPASSPSFMVDVYGNTAQKYLSLPGGVMLTIRPQQTGATSQTFNLSNIHGDVFATLDATGTVLGTTQTGPFGETINGQTLPVNGATGVSYAYVGKHLKATETQLTVKPMQMGARVYLPNIGRFVSVDPVQGGTPNNYVYPTDPVNDRDLNGMWGLKLNAKSLFSSIIFWAKPPIMPRFGGGSAGKSTSTPKTSTPKAAESLRYNPQTIQQGSAEYKAANIKHISPERVKQLQKQGKINAHEAKDGAGRTDLYKDKWGNVYEAVKARQGAGKTVYEPTGDNINTVPVTDDYTNLLVPYGDPA